MAASSIQRPWGRPRLVVVHSSGPVSDMLERILGQEFVLGTTTQDADAVVIETTRHATGAIELLERLKAGDAAQAPRVVLVAPDVPDEVILAALRLDVEGLVTTRGDPESVLHCVREVVQGRSSLDQPLLRRAVKNLLVRSAALRVLEEVLSPRELEIARLVAAGLTNKEIAARLFVAEGTTKVHLHNIFRKVGVRTRQALTDYLRERRIE